MVDRFAHGQGSPGSHERRQRTTGRHTPAAAPDPGRLPPDHACAARAHAARPPTRPIRGPPPQPFLPAVACSDHRPGRRPAGLGRRPMQCRAPGHRRRTGVVVVGSRAARAREHFQGILGPCRRFPDQPHRRRCAAAEPPLHDEAPAPPDAAVPARRRPRRLSARRRPCITSTPFGNRALELSTARTVTQIELPDAEA